MSILSVPASQLPLSNPMIGDEMELRIRVRVIGIHQESERISLRDGTGDRLRELIEPKELQIDLLVGDVIDE